MADRSPATRRRKISAPSTAWENGAFNRGNRLMSSESSIESDGRKRPPSSSGVGYGGWQSEADYMAQINQCCDEVSQLYQGEKISFFQFLSYFVTVVLVNS